MALILASGSPRRRELMALITPDYTVITSDADEGKIAADTPAHLAQSLASAKARAVAKLHPADTVLGFDTVVDCGGEVFGKPQDEADALRMLLQALKAQREPQVVVDAGALTTFDSSALAVLLECRRTALFEGRGFMVKALPPALASLAGLYGVQELLPAV